MTHVCMSAVIVSAPGGGGVALRSRNHCKPKDCNDQCALNGFELRESVCSCRATGFSLAGNLAEAVSFLV